MMNLYTLSNTGQARQDNEYLNNIAGPCQHKPEDLRCTSCIMDTSYYFDGMAAEAKQHLQQFLHLNSFTRKEILYREGQKSESLYILISGTVKIYKSLPTGNQQIHKLVQVPGDMIACEDLFLDQHGSSAEAIDDVTVCYLRQADFREGSAHYPQLSDTLMQMMARGLNSYIRHIANLGQKNALQRVASYLVFLKETHHERNLRDNILKESLSRVELADMLGVTQRTLIRGLRRLEEHGYIELRRNAFVIHDLTALERIGAGIPELLPLHQT
jgi:CRP/FNR family transcriptional regulator